MTGRGILLVANFSLHKVPKPDIRNENPDVGLSIDGMWNSVD